MSHPEQDPLPGLGPQPPQRSRTSRPVLAGLLVAVISAAAGAAIAHEAWSGPASGRSGLPSAGQFSQNTPSPAGSSGAAAATSTAAVAAKVDPGLVDINTTLGGAGGEAAG